MTMQSEAKRVYDNLKNQVTQAPKVQQTPLSRVAEARKDVEALESRVVMLVDSLIGRSPERDGETVDAFLDQSNGLLEEIVGHAEYIQAMTRRAHRELDRLSKVIG